MSNNDKKVAEFDSSHVVYVDPDTGNLEIYKRSTKDARNHADRLRALNHRNAEYWAKRIREEQGE